ncbi:LacI family DNA-binding transcriptional regulator [Microbacterium sp.]|uniref:LacI family DNA-binding transcriptional regulator n=1 Tax=Microbacterium sp. TaxID=51671 RepID=UPI0032219CE4
MPHTPAPTKPAATRNDVARLAGVSTAVVSYVVNGSKRVSPATETRVREAIAMLGYRPNRAARALRLGSSETLGMVVPDSTNPFFASLAHAVEQSAAERGYDLLMANSDGSLALERRHIDHFATRRVDGVFVCSSIVEPDLRALEQADIPAVLLNQYVATPGVDSVSVDLAGGSRLAVEHLAAHGHRTIGLVIGTNTDNTVDAREVGWRETIARLGLVAGPVLRQPFNRSGGYDAGRWLLDGAVRPTALFVGSDRQAVGLLKALHEAGVRVPEEIAIVSFDGSEDAEYSWPPLSTVAQPIEEMARAAVSALIDGEGEKHHRVFEPTLIRRASCGCAESETVA